MAESTHLAPIPKIFQAILREGKEEFEDLSKRKLNIDDKGYICSEITQKRTTVQAVSKNFHISKSTIYDWLKIYKQDVPLLPRGRPIGLDKISDTAITSVVESALHDKNPLSTSRLQDVVDKERRIFCMRTASQCC